MPPDAVVSAPPPAQAPAGGIIAKLDAISAALDAYAASARATQPSWSTPLGRNWYTSLESTTRLVRYGEPGLICHSFPQTKSRGPGP